MEISICTMHVEIACRCRVLLLVLLHVTVRRSEQLDDCVQLLAQSLPGAQSQSAPSLLPHPSSVTSHSRHIRCSLAALLNV